MNRYYKFAPNVYLAECSQEHDKGEVIELEQAEKTHQWLKDNPDKRPHAYALTYAKNKVNEIQKKLKLAQILWSDESNQHND